MKINNNKIIDLTNNLNDLFKNADSTIANMLKQKNINTRKRILGFRDLLTYKFKYACKYNTQKNTIDDYKYERKIFCDNTAFYKKEKKIPLEYYENIYEKVVAIHKKYAKQTNYTIVSVDGTYNNTNYDNDGKLETSLNMGYFDISNNIPLEIDPMKHKQNHEIKSFISAISNRTIKTENIIFVCDRAYFSYELMNFLEHKNAKFVIRIKNNNKHMPTNFRLINYNFNKESFRELYNNNTKQTDYYKITQKINCNIATNLDNTYDDEAIKKIYNSRWNIEEYFKFIKSNFKFSIMREHNKNTSDTYKKAYTIIKIYSVLEKIFELMYDDITDLKCKNYNVKINKSELLHGLFKIIPRIIFSNLTIDDMLLFLKTYTHLTYTEKDKHNPRISKTPFTKWYIKDYHDKYDIEKMFEAYTCDDPSKINKNLKTRLKNITFEKFDKK